ncbi:hypothetical protein J3E69DRAFT_341119 [Trichoderma sp. SZMC 28015]
MSCIHICYGINKHFLIIYSVIIFLPRQIKRSHTLALVQSTPRKEIHTPIRVTDFRGKSPEPPGKTSR